LRVREINFKMVNFPSFDKIMSVIPNAVS